MAREDAAKSSSWIAVIVLIEDYALVDQFE